MSSVILPRVINSTCINTSTRAHLCSDDIRLLNNKLNLQNFKGSRPCIRASYYNKGETSDGNLLFSKAEKIQYKRRDIFKFCFSSILFSTVNFPTDGFAVENTNNVDFDHSFRMPKLNGQFSLLSDEAQDNQKLWPISPQNRFSNDFSNSNISTIYVSNDDSENQSVTRLPASAVLGVDTWPRFRGDGFAVRVPPGFQDLTPIEEVGEYFPSTLQETSSNSPFAARFASPDGEEVITVIVKPTTQIKLSLFEIKDVTDLGPISEAAKLFLPPGATLIAYRQYQSSSVRVPKSYYLFEFVLGDKRVAMSTAIHKGKTYVLGATSTKNNWKTAAARLRATAGAFALIV